MHARANCLPCTLSASAMADLIPMYLSSPTHTYLSGWLGLSAFTNKDTYIHACV